MPDGECCYDAAIGDGWIAGSACCFDILSLCLRFSIRIFVKHGLSERFTLSAIYREAPMRTVGVLPKSVLILEIIGMVLLSLALLSLNDYLTLPAPLTVPLA